LRVVTTGVCTTLETRAQPWRCAPVGDGVAAPGPVIYYTRIANTQARTRVEHRWYQDDVLRLTRSLSLGYSPSEGYRTYSRYTPAPGQWRVELVSADGTVLHEAQFEVR
jgi:Protein of unknown function (DUF2914)